MSTQTPENPEPHVSECVKRRVSFLLCLLQQYNVRAVAESLGIKDSRFITRLMEDLRLHASIAEAPRKGRPVLYTDVLLQQAQEYMLEGVDAAWSKADIVAGMIEAGILAEDTSVDSFWERFTDYMRQHGTPIVYGCQLMTFAMSLEHISKRLAWCHRHKDLLTEQRIGDYWFMDEVAIEESGLPKGGWLVRCLCNTTAMLWQPMARF